MKNILTIITLILPTLIKSQDPYNILYEWSTLDFNWKSDCQKQQYINEEKYIKEHCALTGLKVYKDQVFVTVPRWRTGVPSTLNLVVVNEQGNAVLQPYPSWEMNDQTNPNNIIYTQSMEIDNRGWMWIIDVGRQNIQSANQSLIINGTPKIIVWDIENDKEIKRLELDNNTAPYNASFLNDITVDEETNMAYISDTGTGSMIIYDFNNNRAKRFTSDTMKNEPNVSFTINGVDYGNSTFQVPMDGIALKKGSTVFYCALQGLTLYSIATEKLNDWELTNQQLQENIIEVGQKLAPSDGMQYLDDILYMGGLTTESVYAWNVNEKLTQCSQKEIIINHKDLQWVDTFATKTNDKGKSLFMTSNKLDEFFSFTMDFSGNTTNFRIIELPLDKTELKAEYFLQ